MACKTVKYVNLTDEPIRFVKGLSGVPWPGCDSEPGGVVEAPDTPGYARYCAAAGYTLVTPELQKTLDEDAQLAAMMAEDAAKSKAAEEAKVSEPEPVEQQAPVEFQAPAEPSPSIETEQSTKGSNNRGRSNRSTKG
jgi:hypothetical protein